MSQQTQPAHFRVAMHNLCKTFGGIRALRQGTLCVQPGEIHALVGENGAGKSTLVNILSGVVTPDAGSIAIDGQAQDIDSPALARALGIGMVSQQPELVPDLSVAENILLHALPNVCGFLSWEKLYRRARACVQETGFAVPATAPVRELSVAQRHMVAIAKAIFQHPKILILDEPTSVFGDADAKRLFALLARLKGSGCSIIYISHRLEEIVCLADNITVMRDGEVLETIHPAQTNTKDLIQRMVGRDVTSVLPQRSVGTDDERLRVENLCVGTRVTNVSFDVRRGEVFGISGLTGSGRSRAVRGIFGAEPLTSGKIFIDGQQVRIRMPKDAVQAGIGLVPEDRQRDGAVTSLSISTNTTMTDLKAVCRRGGLLDLARATRVTQGLIHKLSIKTPGCHAPVETLSGGNQQKVVLAKWLHAGCKVLFLDEPTQGIDVGAKAEIYALIGELAQSGMAVVLVSSEMMEIIGLCNRVMVMKKGKSRGVLQGHEISETLIIKMAMEN